MKKFKIFIVVFILSYVFIVVYAELKQESLNDVVSQLKINLDLNKNGRLESSERTVAYYDAIKEASSQTALTFAPYTGIIYAGIFGLIGQLLYYISNKIRLFVIK